MNKISISFIIALFFKITILQSQFCDTYDTISHQANFVQTHKRDFKKEEHCNKIRLNIHFFLKSNGTGNFNEVSDGFGNSLSGYDVAFEIVKRLNKEQENNPPLNTPPFNTIPNLPKNFDFELNGVFFHRDDVAYTYQSSFNINNTFGSEQNEVINVFYTYDPNRSEVGGYASSIDPTSILYTEISMYRRYTQYVNNTTNNIDDYIDWWYHSLVNTTAHELGHLLSLRHVVANTCNTCNDGCDDTPTRQEIIDTWGVDPVCGWANLGFGCTNNLMDYGGFFALSPCQLNKIQDAISQNNGANRYLVCKKLLQNQTFCEINGAPNISYYGKKVRLAPCSQPMLIDNLSIVHFNEDVEIFQDFEVKRTFSRNNNLLFEIKQACKCD